MVFENTSSTYGKHLLFQPKDGKATTYGNCKKNCRYLFNLAWKLKKEAGRGYKIIGPLEVLEWGE